MYRFFVKRFMDCFLSIVGLMVCCIPMLIIAVVIKATSKGPVIFKQERLGKKERIFTVLKFRTMVDHAYEHGGLAIRSDDPRITRAGAFLRRTSLDELPQMINILKMTLIYYMAIWLKPKNMKYLKNLQLMVIHTKK